MSGVLLTSAVLAAVGAGTTAYANNQSMRQQDRIAAQGIIKQGELNRQGTADVQKNIDAAKANTANLAKNQQNEQQQYAAALQRAKPVQDSSFNSTPGGSARYAADVGKAIQGNNAFGANQARSMSITDAPSITNMQTQQGLADTATKLGMLGDTSGNQANLTQMKVNSTQANPWLLALGSTLQGAGAGYGGVAGGKKKTDTSGLSGDTAANMGLGDQ